MPLISGLSMVYTQLAKICEVHYLGLVPYQQAWDLQRTLADQVADGLRSPTLLLLEHPHTYTFGRRGNSENLRWSLEECQEKGVDIHEPQHRVLLAH